MATKILLKETKNSKIYYRAKNKGESKWRQEPSNENKRFIRSRPKNTIENFDVSGMRLISRTTVKNSSGSIVRKIENIKYGKITQQFKEKNVLYKIGKNQPVRGGNNNAKTAFDSGSATHLYTIEEYSDDFKTKLQNLFTSTGKLSAVLCDEQLFKTSTPFSSAVKFYAGFNSEIIQRGGNS